MLASIIMAAGVPVQAAPAGRVGMEIALQVGGRPVAINGTGDCIYTDASTIYEAPATQWGARLDEPGRAVHFTMWRLRRGGPDMLTMSIVLGGTTHRVNTTKVGEKTAGLHGSGTSTFTKSGAGGVFTIDATADTGAKISGRITCSAFSKPEDNG
jgi:hypothetical protein